MIYDLVTLGDLSEVVSKGTTPTSLGVSFSTRGIPFLRAEDIIGGAVNPIYVKYYVDEKTHKTTLGRSQLKPGDFLITIAGSLGRVGYVPVDAPEMNCNQAIAFVRLKPNVINLNYLLYIFQSKRVISRLLDNQKVGTIGNLNLEQIRDFAIPLPPLPEQRRIAALLVRADDLRGRQRYADGLSASLLQSVFLEMFGDPASNPKGWNNATLGDVITSVKDGPHVSPDYYENGVPFLSTRNIRPGQLIWEDIKYISFEDAKKFWKRTGSKPAKGDILYTKGGTTGYAKVVDFDRQVAVWVHIAVLKLRHNLVNQYWLESMLNSNYCYKQSQELTFGIVNHDFGIQRMPKVKIFLPPLPEQERFARIVRRVEALRGRQAEARRQADGLFQSLLQQSFGKG